MTVLRNAVKRKTHKERAQPSGRKKLGLLEKKKDYKLRARDYAEKKKRIEVLRQKAELRNEDEFYFGMKNQKTRGGVHLMERKNQVKEPLSLEISRKLDKNYIESKLTQEKHLLSRLQNGLHFVENDEVERPKKVIFIEQEEEEEEEEEEKELSPINTIINGDKGYQEIIKRSERIKVLSSAIEHIELKRRLNQKGKRIKIAEADGNTPAQYRWAQQRKR